jgi:hypothetical protein
MHLHLGEQRWLLAFPIRYWRAPELFVSRTYTHSFAFLRSSDLLPSLLDNQVLCLEDHFNQIENSCVWQPTFGLVQNFGESPSDGVSAAVNILDYEIE